MLLPEWRGTNSMDRDPGARNVGRAWRQGARALLLWVLACLLIPATSWGQSYNIDLGADEGTPTSAYGGAAGTPGLWNTLTTSGLHPLLSTTGISASVTVNVSDSPSGNFAGAATDDHRLLGDNVLDCINDDWLLEFDSLVPATYTVTLYAPEHPAVETGDMNVNGLTVSNLVGNLSTLVDGVSYASVDVSVTDGTLVVSSDGVGAGSNCAGIAGVQVTEIGPPSLPALLPLSRAVLLLSIVVAASLVRMRARVEEGVGV